MDLCKWFWDGLSTIKINDAKCKEATALKLTGTVLQSPNRKGMSKCTNENEEAVVTIAKVCTFYGSSYFTR